MIRAFAFLAWLGLFVLPVYPQTPAPRKLDDLIQRAGEFRRLIAAGNRAKALEFVVSTGRDEFLNNPVMPVQNPQTAGMDFLNRDRVHVRTTGKMMLAVGGGIPQLRETVVTDVWVWEKDNWYFQPASATQPFLDLFSRGAPADPGSLDEIKSSFKLPSNIIDAGQLAEGERRYIPVPFQYTGSSPIRIEAKLETPLAILDTSSTRSITAQSKAFGVWIGADDFDGPFNTVLIVTVFYKDVSIDHTLTFQGSIRAPLKYRQIPEIVPSDSKAEFQVFVRNNMDETMEISGIFDEGKFFVRDFPRQLAPGEEKPISLRRNLAAPAPGAKIGLFLKSPVQGRSEYEVKIH